MFRAEVSAPPGVMPAEPAPNQRISPTRLLKMLSDHFGACEAIANPVYALMYLRAIPAGGAPPQPPGT